MVDDERDGGAREQVVVVVERDGALERHRLKSYPKSDKMNAE